MCAHTTKIGIAGKYGTRIGRRMREELKKIHTAREESTCPNCGKKVKRFSIGIWKCKKCGLEFTAGAYSVKPIKIKEGYVEEEEEEEEK